MKKSIDLQVTQQHSVNKRTFQQHHKHFNSSFKMSMCFMIILMHLIFLIVTQLVDNSNNQITNQRTTSCLRKHIDSQDGSICACDHDFTTLILNHLPCGEAFFHCSFNCSRDPLCVSFNFWQVDSVCEIYTSLRCMQPNVSTCVNFFKPGLN